MKEKTHHIIYTSSDIEKYLSSKMTNVEMHALEMAALDDSLLADAIEGYEGMEAKNWDKVLNELKATIAAKQKSKVINIKIIWRSIAAAILLLMSSIMVTYVIKTNKSNPIIAGNLKTDSIANENEAIQSDSTVMLIDTSINDVSKDIEITFSGNSTIASINKLPNTLGRADSTQLNNIAVNDFIYTPTLKPAEKNKSIAAIEGKGSQPDLITTTSSEINRGNNISDNRASFWNYSNNSNVEIGNIPTSSNQPNSYEQEIGSNNKALENNVAENQSALKNENIYPLKALTDSNITAFNIVESDKKKQLLQQALTLKEASSEKENIASRQYAIKKKQARTNPKSNNFSQNNLSIQQRKAKSLATPLIGWEAYETYLKNNAHTNSNIQGAVQILLHLDDKGNIKSIKVIKSLSEECDAKAIQLIKNGSSWLVKKEQETTITLIIKF